MTSRNCLAIAFFAVTTLAAQVALADDLIEEYNAYIGHEDLFNSNGVRLRQPWQIIRQDRANVHKFGISQNGDELDSFFASADNRAIAERMIRNGSITADARRSLLEGDVDINVRVYRSDEGDYLDITVK